MTRALRWLTWAMVWGGALVTAQPSCTTVERTAAAEERPVSAETSAVAEAQRCELGSMSALHGCGGLAAACHICARLDGDDGLCVQPCTLGGNDCPGGQTCRPIGELRDAGGYARQGDCPAGYCR